MTKKLRTLLLIALLVPVSYPAQQTPAQPKVRIQTPFGPIEVDADDPRARNAAPAAPAPAAQNPPQSDDAAAPIALHLDNADIYQVVRIIGDALGISYVIDPTVKGTVNINTAGNLRRSDLLPILETVLKINGATMIQSGNFYQIVPANSAIRQPLPVQDARPGASTDDQIVMQIVRMKFVMASEMGRLLTPYLSDGANIVVHDSGNILLISERRSNLRKLIDVIDIFDTNVFEGERIRIFPLKEAQSGDVVDDLQRIFAGYGFSSTGSAIRFISIARLNSILVITANPTVFPEVEKWVGRLEQSGPVGGIRNFVYKVRNTKAVAIQRVLAELYGVAPTQAGSSGAQTTAPPPIGSPMPGAGASPGALPAPSMQAQPGVKIIADELNNALVIQASPQEYADMEKTIEQLDQLRRQVLIDAQVYEVVLDHGLSLGITAQLQNRGTLTPATTAAFASGSGGGPPSLSAQTFALIGRTRELFMFLNASENRSRVRTVSSPSVMVSDNTQAEFQVGAEVPIPTSSSITPVQSSGTNLFAQTIQFRNTGVILRVKPQINDSGNVTLEISQEVSQAGANTTSGIVAPVIGKSSVNSTIVVRDGETIALSGFIRENNELGRSRVPIIGSVPVLGMLFGNTRRSVTRSELIVLITPHVARTFEEATTATDELKKKLKEVQKLLK